MDALAEAYQTCFQSFADRDYTGCIRQAFALIQSDLPPTMGAVTTFELLLISLQRTKQTELLGQIGPMVVATLNDPYYSGIAQLTLGNAQLSDVAPLAASEEQRCQLLFYLGARRATIGEVDAAVESFQLCLLSESDPIVKQLALAELISLRPGLVDRPRLPPL